MTKETMTREEFYPMWHKFNKKDYFSLREGIKGRITLCRENNRAVSYAEFIHFAKQVFKAEREKCYKFMCDRLESMYQEGYKPPQREKFSWYCWNTLTK